jgi:uncharacterized membrane protein YedE/YeeE
MLRAICSWVLASSSAALTFVRLACAFGIAAFAVASAASACFTLAFDVANFAESFVESFEPAGE